VFVPGLRRLLASTETRWRIRRGNLAPAVAGEKIGDGVGEGISSCRFVGQRRETRGYHEVVSNLRDAALFHHLRENLLHRRTNFPCGDTS